MAEKLTQLLVTQLSQRIFATLGTQRRIPHHPLLPLRAGASAEDQPEFVFDVLGNPATDGYLPLLPIHLDDAARHSGGALRKLLESGFDVGHEAVGIRAVDDPMIEG